ncbi:hypothetical protein K32_21080 [Kaistia sp. 32K]|nr:hypothetical protein K32_21080 [Kaistia sp. 32K]
MRRSGVSILAIPDLPSLPVRMAELLATPGSSGDEEALAPVHRADSAVRWWRGAFP